MKMYRQSNALGLTKPVLQYIHNLMGRSNDPKLLAGEIMCDDEEEKVVEHGRNHTILLSHYYYSASLAFLFGDMGLADEFMEKSRSLNFRNPAVFRFTVNRWTEGLIAVARLRQGVQLSKYRKIAGQVLQQLTRWSRDSPDNFCSKRLLLSAEMLSLKSGTKLQKHVKNQYKESARLALHQGFTQEAALACELAGNYQHRCGALDDAMVDWRRSCEFYKECQRKPFEGSNGFILPELQWRNKHQRK
jgi:hypothetical protein